MSQIVAKRQAPFCERYFSWFFILWGLVLYIDAALLTAHRGLFLGRLEHYFPGWAWGSLMIAIGIGRLIAFAVDNCCWRIWLSMLTFVLLSVIAALALASGLWAATAPLATFVAAIAYWCHVALLRDLRLGI